VALRNIITDDQDEESATQLRVSLNSLVRAQEETTKAVRDASAEIVKALHTLTNALATSRRRRRTEQSEQIKADGRLRAEWGAEERQAWMSFVLAWADRYPERAVTVNDLVEVCPRRAAFFGTDNMTERGRRIRLGVLLRQARDQRFGDLVVRWAGSKHHAQRWCLEHARRQAA
jgi:hypothetical protein